MVKLFLLIMVLGLAEKDSAWYILGICMWFGDLLVQAWWTECTEKTIVKELKGR